MRWSDPVIDSPIGISCRSAAEQDTLVGELRAQHRQTLLLSRIHKMKKIQTIVGNTGYRHQLDRVRRFLDRVEGPHASDIEFQDIIWSFLQKGPSEPVVVVANSPVISFLCIGRLYNRRTRVPPMQILPRACLVLRGAQPPSQSSSPWP